MVWGFISSVRAVYVVEDETRTALKPPAARTPQRHALCVTTDMCLKNNNEEVLVGRELHDEDVAGTKPLTRRPRSSRRKLGYSSL